MSRTLVRALPLLLASLVPAVAQTPPASPAEPAAPPPVMPVAPTATTTPAATEKPFTLEDAISLAMRKNFDLQVQSYTVANAKDTIAIQQAAFDPTVSASGRRSLNQQASTTSRLDGTLLLREGPRSDNTVMSVGTSLPKLAATNGAVSVTANVQRAATNSQNALVNPSFTSGVSANLNQPLLNGAGRHMATAALNRAKLGLNIASINYKSRVLSVIADTENAFFNLVATREALRIRQFTLQSNQRLLEENQARRTTGVATDLDVLSADYGVANARRGLVQAEQNVRDAEDRLLNLINVPEFDQRVGPVSFSAYTEGVPSFAVSYKRAREYYPDTLSTEESIKQLELDLETARRNQQPDLNLIASLGYGGLATSEGYSQAISNLPQEHGNNWSLGLNYSMPWGRHADKARYRTAQSNLTSRKLQLEQLEQTLLVNVRTAVRAVESNMTTAEIAAKATELAVRQYEQQKARYDAGLSTSRLVLLAQDDVENARFQELSARLALRRAVTELRRLEGSSIDYYKVMLPGTGT